MTISAITYYFQHLKSCMCGVSLKICAPITGKHKMLHILTPGCEIYFEAKASLC